MRLWIDTNRTQSAKALRDLCRLARSKQVAVVVHAQVYLETRRQRRVQSGVTFDELVFDQFLKREKITVFDAVLDQRTATSFADLLHLRYPTDEAWELAKRQTIGGKLRADFEAAPGKMPMTTDWLIALAVEADPGSRIITHDDGEEWRHLREANRALYWDDAIAWLEGLPEQPPAAPLPEEHVAPSERGPRDSGG